jgi:hypothetical protein
MKEKFRTFTFKKSLRSMAKESDLTPSQPIEKKLAKGRQEGRGGNG